ALHLLSPVLAAARAATGLLVLAILRRTATDRAALLGLFLWMYNPYIIATSLAGIEVPLATCTIAAAGLYWIRLRDRERLDPASAVRIGVLVGVALLARTDSVFFALALGLDLLRVVLRQRRHAMSCLLAFGAAVAALFGPWLAWCVVRTGHVTQSSARAL